MNEIWRKNTFQANKGYCKKEMVVIKNINADVHLIDYNMYMFMMKYNIEE